MKLGWLKEKAVETEQEQEESGKKTPVNMEHKVTSAKRGAKPKPLVCISGSEELVQGSPWDLVYHKEKRRRNWTKKVTDKPYLQKKFCLGGMERRDDVR